MANPPEKHPDVAESGDAQLRKGALGPPTDVICPECGGSLWEFLNDRLAHYQCHVGHSFTAEALLQGKSTELESALWAALRALEESAQLRRRMALRLANAPGPLHRLKQDYERQAKDADAKSALLRAVLGNGAVAERLAEMTNAESEAVAAEGNEALQEATPARLGKRSKDMKRVIGTGHQHRIQR